MATLGRVAPRLADPALVAAVREWRGRHTKAEILAAVEEACRVSPLSAEVTRAQREQLRQLIDQLGGREACDRWLWQLIQREKHGDLPFAILLEVVRRVAEYRPKNVWAYIEHVMKTDYPAYAWGKR